MATIKEILGTPGLDFESLALEDEAKIPEVQRTLGVDEREAELMVWLELF